MRTLSTVAVALVCLVSLVGCGSSPDGPEQVVAHYVALLKAKDCGYLALETPASLAADKESEASCRAGAGHYFSALPADVAQCSVTTTEPGIAGDKALVAVRVTCPQAADSGKLTIALLKVKGRWLIANAN